MISNSVHSTSTGRYTAGLDADFHFPGHFWIPDRRGGGWLKRGKAVTSRVHAAFIIGRILWARYWRGSDTELHRPLFPYSRWCAHPGGTDVPPECCPGVMPEGRTFNDPLGFDGTLPGTCSTVTRQASPHVGC